MKTVSVLLADISVMQPMLDQEFGVNVFIINRIINQELEWKEYFLTYDDSVPQATVDQAVQFVNKYHSEILNDKKIRWYTKMQDIVQEKTVELTIYKFTPQEMSETQQWLDNTSLPVPGCVMFISLKNNLTLAQAATYIINSDANYQNLVSQLNAILLTFQNNLMASDLRGIKPLVDQTLAEINNFPQLNL